MADPTALRAAYRTGRSQRQPDHRLGPHVDHAGAPRGDRLKCALKPVDPADYSRKGIGQRAPETRLAFPAEGRSVKVERWVG